MSSYLLVVLGIVAGLARGSAAAQAEPPEQKVAMKDLPPAVQKAIQDHTGGARIKGLARKSHEGRSDRVRSARVEQGQDDGNRARR
jgi:hypothetical protein